MAEARTPRRRTGKADPETDEAVYQAILRAIMEGKLKAGTKLVENPLAQIFKEAGVRFAILGKEESCCGDPARRPGNEYLFQTLAQVNVELMNTYGVRKVITACPHCFNTLKNEYPDFGAKLEVIHHTDFLLALLAEKKLNPRKPVQGKVDDAGR